MNFPQEFTHIPETREKILLAAKKEFAEKGYDGARMGLLRGAWTGAYPLLFENRKISTHCCIEFWS